MGGTIKFDYYYGIEAEQFSFYRVPRLLIKDERFKGLSSDAKLLYGLMLDRMALSMKNGWLDDENRAYIIYTVDSIMEDLGCGKDKAIKVLAELDTNKGIGLVERIRRGLGKPDIIYVKNFVIPEENDEQPDKQGGDKGAFTEDGEADLQKSEKPTSRSLRSRLQEVGKTDFNEHHMKYDKRQDRDLYEELFEVICEVVCVKRKTVRIAGEDYPYELVKSKFLKLNSGHLEYVIGCMHDTVTKITNIKAYMVTALYNAPSTMNHYYQQEVQHDMYGGGWEEKGIV